MKSNIKQEILIRLLYKYNFIGGKNREPKEAIEKAIEECIKEGILSDFLKKNRAEALEMSWYEYNEELHIKNERAIAFEEGVEQERKKTEEQRKIAEKERRCLSCTIII